MGRVAISKSRRFRIFMRDNFMCRYCGARGEGVVLHVDHIDPVSGGGSNDDGNLVTACQPCNAGKGAVFLEVLPPWEPLPEKPRFERKKRGRVFRVGAQRWEAEEDFNRTESEALNEVYRRFHEASRSEDEDGCEAEPCDHLELVIWRPAENPYSRHKYEAHAAFVYDRHQGEFDVWADDLEEEAREIFDALPHHEGWTYWRGGTSPLADHLDEWRDCEFIFRSGHKGKAPKHIDQPWAHHGPEGWIHCGDGDIIAYRVATTAPRGEAVWPSYPVIRDLPPAMKSEIAKLEQES